MGDNYEECKKRNFARLAESRANKVLKGLELIGNLSNTSHYEYTPAQVEKIFSAIQKEVYRQKNRFRGKAGFREKFSL